MNKQPFNLRPLLLLSLMAMLFFGLYTPEAMATAPKQALKGALPIPGTSQTSNFLTLSQHGAVLENDDATLEWQNDGNLVLSWCGQVTIWASNTGGNGKLLVFDGNTGRLEVQDLSGNVIWTTNKDGGAKLELQDNRNLVMLNASNSTLWQTNTSGFQKDMNTDGLQTLEFKNWGDLVYELRVPTYTTHQYLYIHAEGADGGKRQVKEAWGATRFTVNGGSGASIAGVFEIGTGINQIPPGSSVRVIIGQKGNTRAEQTTAGCGGGGGTGVLYKRPNDSEWRLLVVAGGGGGAYSDCCTAKSEGKSAETTENGSGGNWSGSSGTGGTNGNAGTGHIMKGNGGDGDGIKFVYEGVSNDCYSNPPDWYGHSSWLWKAEDRTILPTGRGSYDNGDGCVHMDGGSGFGAGGWAAMGGGGGGGYSGGGSGRDYHGGGGGGSYLNSDMAKYSYKIKNSSTSDTQDGFVRYEFLSSSQLARQIKFAYNTSKCIDDTGSSTSNGTNILSYSCTGNPNQKWFFHPTDRTVRSMLNIGKCLDLTGGNTSNGTNIQLWDCVSGNANQFWVYNGLYKTIHSGKNSDKCFDAADGSKSTSNVNLQLWDCQYTNNNQKWNIDGATTVSNVSNMKHIVPVSATGFAVHSHTGAESGSNIQLWTKDNTNTAEQWYFDGLAIKMRSNQNLCIDLNQSNTDNGNNIQLYTCNGTNAQKWLYDGMTQSIRSVVNPDKCMQIEKNTDGVYGKRSNVVIQDCNGSAHQQFLIQE